MKIIFIVALCLSLILKPEPAKAEPTITLIGVGIFIGLIISEFTNNHDQNEEEILEE